MKHSTLKPLPSSVKQPEKIQRKAQRTKKKYKRLDAKFIKAKS